MLKTYSIILAFFSILLSFSAFSAESVSIDEIKQLAEQGDALAQAKYGSIYFLGDKFQLKPNSRFKIKQKYQAITYLLEGIEKNDQTATRWLKKSAEQGYADAEVFMAALYDRGMGVNQNKSEATQLYQKASKHGNEMATALLGRYANSRLTASKDIPVEYALKILNTQ